MKTHLSLLPLALLLVAPVASAQGTAPPPAPPLPGAAAQAPAPAQAPTPAPAPVPAPPAEPQIAPVPPAPEPGPGHRHHGGPHGGGNMPVYPGELAAPDERSAEDSPLAADGHPLAGYHAGLFYLRDHNDDFHLYIQGRSQVDFYSYLGAGVPQTALKPTLFLRRVRPEITGEFLHHWRFMIAGDFGATAIDNPKGTNEVSAAGPGAAPSATSARFAAAQSTRFQSAATDVFLNYREGTLFNVQVGQFDAPFMLENRTSDKYIQFMERSLAVRAIGIPTNKEIGAMAWGETKNRLFYYSVGPFNGDGQNRPNVDARFDLLSRIMIHPLATTDVGDKALRDMHLGASFRYGSRDKKWVEYDYPTMTTQGSYAFWSPNYTASNGVTHIIPSGDQIAVAGELRVPFDRFDLTSEVVYINNNTREAIEGFEATNTERFGNISGVSYYAQLGWWAFGQRDINGTPGYENPARLDWSKTDPETPAQALQLLAKWEQVSLKYDSASRAGVADAKNIDGNIKVNALSFGVNYWATKHVRLSLNYIYNQFPDSAPVKATAPGGPAQSSTNRALAPGNTLATGVDDSARDTAHDLHEILARFAIAL